MDDSHLNLDRMYNYDDEFNTMMEEKYAKLVGNKKYANKFQVFRDNFLNFEKLINFYQLNKAYGKEHGETASGEIKKFLIRTGHIKSVDEISDSLISSYMNKVREERKLAKKRGGKKKSISAEIEAVQAENFDRGSLPGQVGDNEAVEVVEASLSHQKDWLDTSWIGAEPNWNQLTTVGGERPGSEGWNDDWENVWRHLHKRADEAGHNEHEKTTYATFRAMGADIGALWLDLNKFRRAHQKEYGWNPYGVGK